MEINTQGSYAGCRISKGGGHSSWTNYKQKYMEFLNVYQMSPGNYISLVQSGPLDPPLRVDILGADILAYANNKGADQPAHQHSLISAFGVHFLDSIIPILAKSKLLRF